MRPICKILQHVPEFILELTDLGEGFQSAHSQENARNRLNRFYRPNPPDLRPPKKTQNYCQALPLLHNCPFHCTIVRLRKGEIDATPFSEDTQMRNSRETQASKWILWIPQALEERDSRLCQREMQLSVPPPGHTEMCAAP